MFEFLKRKRHLSAPVSGDEIPPLFFANGAAALEYACKFMDCPLQDEIFLPALVLDAREVSGTKEAVMVQKDGNQLAMLRVASDDGGFVVLATTAGPMGPKLQPGQLVAWRAGKHVPEIAASMGAKDKRSGWVGLIIGTLKPEYRDGRWGGGDRFTP